MSNLARFDTDLTRGIQNLPGWFHPIMNIASVAGAPATVVFVALAAALAAWRQGEHRLSYAFIATIAADGVNGTLKHFIHRLRPDTVYVTNMRFKSYSFPSGHSFGSLLLYGLLAYLALRYLPAPWSWLAAAAASILIILVGLSRIYLGAHYPTDVIGGWLLAAIFLVLIIRFVLK